MKCKNCVRHIHLNDDGERTPGTPNWCFYLNDSPDEEIERDCAAFKPITNYDRIISGTPEEMAEFLAKNGDCPPEKMYPLRCPDCGRVTPKVCYDCWLDWLKQEAQ